jgi:gas vesicle protein
VRNIPKRVGERCYSVLILAAQESESLHQQLKETLESVESLKKQVMDLQTSTSDLTVQLNDKGFPPKKLSTDFLENQRLSLEKELREEKTLQNAVQSRVEKEMQDLIEGLEVIKKQEHEKGKIR